MNECHENAVNPYGDIMVKPETPQKKTEIHFSKILDQEGKKIMSSRLGIE